MKLSFSTLGCPGWGVEEVAKRAALYGFDGVELRVKGDRHVDTAMSSAERARVRRLFEDRSVEICCLAGYTRFNSGSPQELEENRNLMLKYIDLAVDFGAPYIRTFIGRYPEEMTEDEVAANAAYYLGQAGETAERKGVTILIETHDAFGTGQKVDMILGKINNNGVAALWDVHHPFCDGEPVETTYGILGNRIKHIHIKDSYIAADGKDTHCLVGKGALPVGEIVRLMKSKGYDGYYSLESEKMWLPELEEPEVALPQYLEYMKQF